MKIAIGCDHAGFDLKREIIRELADAGNEVNDLGAYDDRPSDYPDFALAVAQAVASASADRGIFICGTGVGPAMVANRVPGIRAAVCNDTFCAHTSREHNDANVLTLGSRVVGSGLALDIVKTWLATPFTGEERHRRRVAKMMALDRR
ncbi:MAG: ribose 5-phosphate isomerase B [Chloroflexi bacterium]|nr:ribose 5-phosphate isomerase B [Chloroflexota bacterium]